MARLFDEPTVDVGQHVAFDSAYGTHLGYVIHVSDCGRGPALIRWLINPVLKASDRSWEVVRDLRDLNVIEWIAILACD